MQIICPDVAPDVARLTALFATAAGFSAAILTYECVSGTVIVAAAVTDVAVKIDFLVALGCGCPLKFKI